MAKTLKRKMKKISRSLEDKLEPYVRQHLAKLYMVLGFTTVSTGLGVTLFLFKLVDFGLLATFMSLALVTGLHFYKYNRRNYYTRLSMLLSFGFCSGQILGPLVEYITATNPAILFTALVGTAVTFASLSLAALTAERGKYLYLGGLLVSIVNTIAVLNLFNMFFQSYFVHMAQLYVGVFVASAFVVFDSQNIIEKCRAGNRDVVQHALELFFDALSMFRRLLIILTAKDERKGRRSL